MTNDCENEGTCELIIYCFKCKSMFQLNPQMIVVSLLTDADIWEVYNYILTIKCTNCEKNDQ